MEIQNVTPDLVIIFFFVFFVAFVSIKLILSIPRTGDRK